MIAELLRLETCDVSHEKAVTLQARLLRHPEEWLVFLDDPRVPPETDDHRLALPSVTTPPGVRTIFSPATRRQ